MRVQIPAYTDRWMMGDRFGTVVKIAKPRGKRQKYAARQRDVAHVKLDKSGKTFTYYLDDCEVVS